MKKILIYLFLITSIFLGDDIIYLKNYKIQRFNPTKGEKVNFEVVLKKKTHLTVNIRTDDEHIIKNLVKNKFYKAGIYKFKWDGRDFKGDIVADGTYYITLEAKDLNISINSKDFSGGELIVPEITIYERKKIILYLSKASKVLLRSAINDGPLIDTILEWKSFLDGFKTINYNGKDKNQVLNIYDYNYSISPIAITLPDYSVITYGNKKIDYFDYYQNLGFIPKIDKKRKLRKNVSDLFYIPFVLLKYPKLEIELKNYKNKKNLIYKYEKNQDIEVFLNIKEKYLKYIDIFGYEVIFYLDGKYIGEVKEGYMPLSYVIKSDEIKKDKHEHILTVNITPLKTGTGISSKSIKIYIDY